MRGILRCYQSKFMLSAMLLKGSANERERMLDLTFTRHVSVEADSVFMRHCIYIIIKRDVYRY